jgi:hypothetical protein
MLNAAGKMEGGEWSVVEVVELASRARRAVLPLMHDLGCFGLDLGDGAEDDGEGLHDAALLWIADVDAGVNDGFADRAGVTNQPS